MKTHAAARSVASDLRPQVAQRARPAMLQRKCSECAKADEPDWAQIQARIASHASPGGVKPAARVEHDFSRIRTYDRSESRDVRAQPQGLILGRADDPAEREADAIASAILRGEAPSAPSIQPPMSGSIQRKGVNGEPCPSEDEMPQRQRPPEEERRVQAKADGSGGGGAVSASFASSLSATRGGGIPLPHRLQAAFQSQLGSPLGDVRLHTDAEAGRLARSIGAEAFTSGAHVYFAPSRYAPGTPAGRHLLAHELVHVVQQRGATAPAPIRRYTLTGFNPTQTAAMNAAIPVAKAKVNACGGKSTSDRNRASIVRGLDAANYVFDAESKICGHSNPFTDTIEVGPKAFDYSKCCALESTLAHECGHSFAWMFEGSCRTMECDCFGCSC